MSHCLVLGIFFIPDGVQLHRTTTKLLVELLNTMTERIDLGKTVEQWGLERSRVRMQWFPM